LALSREVIEMFDKANGGVHPRFRPAHAKGILLTGTLYAVLRGRVADAGAATWAR
jgi:hypothetical protein